MYIKNERSDLKIDFADEKSMQLPVRVVMNNRTITIYGSEKYENIIDSFILKQTELKHSEKYESCFSLVQQKRSAILCPWNFISGENTFKEWNDDFILFKTKCVSDLPVIEINMTLKKKLLEKFKELKENALEANENEMKKKLISQDDKQTNDDLKDTQDMAYKVIEKELSLESLIKEEETEREQREQQEIENQIDGEEKKGNILLRAIKEKEVEDQMSLKAKKKALEIRKIKQAATIEIEKKRNALRDYVMLMRRRHERKKMELKGKLLSVRVALANKMNDAYRIGSQDKCIKALEDQEGVKAYCDGHFYYDLEKLQSCYGADFCNNCCESEFGEANLTQRQDCIDEVCKLQKEKRKEVKKTSNLMAETLNSVYSSAK